MIHFITTPNGFEYTEIFKFGRSCVLVDLTLSGMRILRVRRKIQKLFNSLRLYLHQLIARNC